jgi:predicted NBD/HSP70 family sugar kinase
MASYRLIEYGGKGARVLDYSPCIVFDDKAIRFLPTIEIRQDQTLIDFGVADLPLDNAGIGYSAAGIIDEQGCLIKSPNNPHLTGAPLGPTTRRMTQKPVYVANDMESAIRGMREQNPDLDFFMGATWSSGFGQAFYIHGRIYKSEAAHMTIDNSPQAALCGHGGRGCLESIAGGEHVKRRVINELYVRGIALPEGKHACAYLDECFPTEDWAREIYELICAAMGHFLANIQNTLRFPAIVWKGSFALNGLRSKRLIEDMIRKHMRKHLADPNWERELEFRFVKTPPEVPQDYEAFVGLAKLVEEKAT